MAQKSYGNVMGIMIGVVKDINDPDKLNRVKAIITDSEIETPYMPVLQSIASNKSGQIVIPDVNDVVIIGYIDGKIENGIVLGSIYHGKNKPHLSVDKKNEITMWKTKGETEIVVDDKKDKQKVTVKTKKGLMIELDSGKESVTIADKGEKNFLKLESKKGNLAITTKKKIFFKAGNDTLTLEDGKGLILKSKLGNFKADANNVDLKAKANVKIQGISVTAKGTAKIAIQSNGQAVFKGTLNQIG